MKNDTAETRCRFTVAFLAVLCLIIPWLPAKIYAADCSHTNIELNAQAQVDSFQATYGACDTVSGNLIIDGDDIVDLTPLADVVSAGGLFLRTNPLLTNLDGLEGLSSITNAGSWLSIYANPLLTNIDALSSVTSVAGSLFIGSNASLTSVDGLSGIASFTGDLEIVDNPMLTDLNGLSGLRSVHLEGRLVIVRNDALVSLNGLAGIISVGNYFLNQGSGGGLVLAGNVSLNSLDGLSNITSIDGDLRIVSTALQNLDGLSNLTALGKDVNIHDNAELANCLGIAALLDNVDDDDPGPGPGPDGIPDVAGNVYLENNRYGCNTLAEILGIQINAGFNDAWYNPLTNGQGLLITVFPDNQQMFLAWFTYDIERPPEDVQAVLGDPGHRWLTAQGPYEGDTANLTIFVTSGGVFDSSQPPSVTDQAGDGTMTLEFSDCANGLVSYEITSLGISGEIPIQRIAPDNIAFCETLGGQ
jgi:hypothetical protein